MDGALQATIGLAIGDGNKADIDKQKSMIPVALEGIEVIDRCSNDMWVLAQKSKDNDSNNKIEKYDIDICDESGKVCVRMNALSIKRMD